MLAVRAVDLDEILTWRDLYLQEMSCQVVHDSLHGREGWTRSYVLEDAGERAGYGAVVHGGPWRGKPSVFELYVLPRHRSRLFAFFKRLLAASGATGIDCQTNDPLLSPLFHHFATDVVRESILFEDRLETAYAPAGAAFRQAVLQDAERMFEHGREPVGDWIVEVEGTIAATGGIALHYNRPFGDLFMEVARPFRRRGLGAFTVQELKKTCYAMGRLPAARCDPANAPSRKTLEKAGFAPCGLILSGTVSPQAV